ncbi:MAG: porin family protein [Rhizobiales bacterium]|nr:porin family protein [Hyphomicrobiales bacterium]MBO6699327.1 porin family protein [Hyphomicrobiales bacterium]MBO6736865.1 porin family protein [Hyphomicrobiales bacterium]MBO6912061.1 porin family protein [Hyphomicrobiales bacterium]MBO6954571.1 porin family protein [Hyphomicrobiales bacterium]
MHRSLFSLALAASACLSTPALAADQLAYQQAAPQPTIVRDGPPRWTGFYSGVHAGLGFVDSWDNVDGLLEDKQSFLGGVHAGGSLQVSNVVLGIEGDASLTNFTRPRVGVTSLEISIPWSASVRGRVGYAFGHLLIYGTGGLAVAGVETTSATASSSDTRYGHVIGAGVEWGLTRNIALGGELLRYDFSKENLTLGASFQSEHSQDVVRARLSYRY